MANKRAVGIDLGTTYSAVSWVLEGTHTVMVPNSEGDVLTPSVVLFDDNDVIVGKEAAKVGMLMADRVAEMVKRDMGSPVYSRPIRGEYLPPEVIQACILRKLKADIVKMVGPDYGAVITVPAFFDEPRRRATAQAGEMADLNVLDIVNEPTAAALAFGEVEGYLTPTAGPRSTMTVMVYDLGGGTFDVTLVSLRPGTIETLATDGDVRLGGRDWDMRLVDHAAETFVRDHREDPRSNPASLQRLVKEVEAAKRTLSARQKAKILVEHAGSSSEVTVTRELFEQLTADLMERTVHTSRQVLAAAGKDWNDVNRVLLVGGSTRMPMVSAMLRKLSGKEPHHTVHPDEAVARGAALYAKYLLGSSAAGGETSFSVTNVNSHSLGIEGIEQETLSKRNIILIPRNTKLPAQKRKEFVTKSKGQRSIAIQVLEGESRSPNECTEIAKAVIRDLPAGLPQGAPIDVTYEYGANGRLNVKAALRLTGQEVELELERDKALSKHRVAQWREVLAEPEAGLDEFETLINAELKAAGKPATQRRPSSGAKPAAPKAAPTAGPKQPTPPTGAKPVFDDVVVAELMDTMPPEPKPTPARPKPAKVAPWADAVPNRVPGATGPGAAQPKKPATPAVPPSAFVEDKKKPRGKG